MTNWFTTTVRGPLRLLRMHRSAGWITTLALLLSIGTPGWAERKPSRVVGLHYPRIALAARLEGTITVDATIAPDGAVTEVHTRPEAGLLARTAAVAIKQWRFEAVNGTAAETVRFTWEFKLAGSCKTDCCEDEWVLEFPNRVIIRGKTLPLMPGSASSDSEVRKR